ncbi:MAG TPA: hypothetical protein VFB34_10040 [Chloroflexota bacterium]|nr:hypothetical protein [Chloroflexota bacterium]
MFNEMLEIDEVCTADSVAEANRLLQDGWELIGFHPAPSSTVGITTIFVLARVSYGDEDEEEVDDEEDDGDGF